MTLSTDELQWIDTRMEIYDIKYQEIYNEILDHIITAVEEKRREGDRQDIKWLFQQVVDEHFEGYFGMEKIISKQEAIYREGIRKLWAQSFRYYFNWPMLVFTVIAILLSFNLPNVKAVRITLMIGCLLLAFSPAIYAQFSLSGSFKTIKGKKSILRSHLLSRAAMPAMMLNSIIYLLQLVVLWNDKEADTWNIFKHISPPVSMAIVMLFVVLNLTAIRFCKKLITTNSLA